MDNIRMKSQRKSDVIMNINIKENHTNAKSHCCMNATTLNCKEKKDVGRDRKITAD